MAGGFTRESGAQAIANGHADLVAYGRWVRVRGTPTRAQHTQHARTQGHSIHSIHSMQGHKGTTQQHIRLSTHVFGALRHGHATDVIQYRRVEGDRGRKWEVGRFEAGYGVLWLWAFYCS